MAASRLTKSKGPVWGTISLGTCFSAVFDLTIVLVTARGESAVQFCSGTTYSAQGLLHAYSKD